MRTTLIPLLFLAVHTVYGQLNFEGNPLTEDTVYTAEESHFTETTAKARFQNTGGTEDSYLLAARILKAERSQNLYPSININDQDREKSGSFVPSTNDVSSVPYSSSNSYNTVSNDVVNNTRTAAINDMAVSTQQTPENQETPNPQLSDPSESALTMFLNSKTPQESKMALDEYFTSGQRAAQQTTNYSPNPYQPHISDIVLPNQQSINVDQQLNHAGQMDARYVNYQPLDQANSQSGLNQAVFTVNQNGKALIPIRRPPVSYGRRSYSVRPPYNKGLIYRAQSRVGPIPGYRKGAYGPGSDGLEIIYTKPPGHGNSQYERGKDPYEDASAWFPDANYPPPDVNVYHSQLYAQSYDPNYYNYIAKYGKIKPHLYGKFGKFHNKEEEGLLAELFHSFKKHGMKHVTHPMFLLGFGIPVVTLMLSALVNKQIFGRSMDGIDSSNNITDEEIDEWTTTLRKALECHAQSKSESERMKCVVLD